MYEFPSSTAATRAAVKGAGVVGDQYFALGQPAQNALANVPPALIQVAQSAHCQETAA